MKDLFALTDLEKDFLDKALMHVKSCMATDIIADNHRSENEYLDILRDWSFKTLGLGKNEINIILSYPNKYMKFSGINPNAILSHAKPLLDSIAEKTKEEVSEGSVSWMKTFNEVKEFMSQYPFETEYRFSLPTKVELRFTDESYSSNWISVKVSAKKSSIKSHLGDRVSSFLVKSLEQTMDDKTDELMVESIVNRLPLNEIKGIYSFDFQTSNHCLYFDVVFDSGLKYNTGVYAPGKDSSSELFDFVNRAIESDNDFNKAKEILEDFLAPYGFDLKYSFSYQAPLCLSKFFLKGTNSEGFVVDMVISISDILSDKRFTLVKNMFERAFSGSEQLRDYISLMLLSENVNWQFCGGIPYSTLKLGPFKQTFTTPGGDLSSDQKRLVSNYVDKYLPLAKLDYLVAPILEKHLAPLNVKWEAKFDHRGNYLVHVHLKGIPDIVRSISLSRVEKDVQILVDVVNQKKRILHIP